MTLIKQNATYTVFTQSLLLLNTSLQATGIGWNQLLNIMWVSSS